MIYKLIDANELRPSACELAARLSSPIGHEPEGFERCIDELKAASAPTFVAASFGDLGLTSDGVRIGGVEYKSLALKRVLEGCCGAVLMCATLGFGAERLLRKWSALSPSLHFLADAAADALVEALCDRAEDEIFGTNLRTARFSPGYADLPLRYVKEILCATDAEKLLGVKLGESFLCTPSKTVTAIIGIKKEDKE
jgi:hypothetical protein